MGQVPRRFFSARATWRLVPGGAWASSLASSTSSSGLGSVDSGGRCSASGEDDGNTPDRRYPRGRNRQGSHARGHPGPGGRWEEVRTVFPLGPLPLELRVLPRGGADDALSLIHI